MYRISNTLLSIVDDNKYKNSYKMISEILTVGKYHWRTPEAEGMLLFGVGGSTIW